MPLNAAIQRIQRLMGSTAFLTNRAGGGVGGGAQTRKSNLVGPGWTAGWLVGWSLSRWVFVLW